MNADPPRNPSRRAVLVAGAVPLLAACGGGGGSGSGPYGGVATTSGAPTTEAATGAGATTAAGSQPLVSTADIPPGSAVIVEPTGARPVAVVRPENGEVHALSAVCTHEACVVAVDGEELACPCHGSRFASADGAVVNGPAERPLPAVPIRVEGEKVFLA